MHSHMSIGEADSLAAREDPEKLKNKTIKTQKSAAI